MLIDNIDFIIGAVCSLVPCIITLYASNKGRKNESAMMQKSLSVQYITDKRTEWISTLREELSNFVSLSFAIKDITIRDNNKNDESVSKLTIQRIRSLCKLRLMLGINMNLDNKLLKCLNDIVSKEYVDEEDFILDINELIQISKIYLKVEWERIKLEVSNVDDKIIKKRLHDKEAWINEFYNYVNNIDIGNN